MSQRADTIVSTCRDLCLNVQIQLSQRVETLHVRLSVSERLSAVCVFSLFVCVGISLVSLYLIAVHIKPKRRMVFNVYIVDHPFNNNEIILCVQAYHVKYASLQSKKKAERGVCTMDKRMQSLA